MNRRTFMAAIGAICFTRPAIGARNDVAVDVDTLTPQQRYIAAHEAAMRHNSRMRRSFWQKYKIEADPTSNAKRFVRRLT